MMYTLKNVLSVCKLLLHIHIMYASVKINGLEGVMLTTEKAVSEQIVLTVTVLKIFI